MLKSERLATLPLDDYDLDAELAVLDSLEVNEEYDAFTFGGWSSHVLANSSGEDADTAFRPHGETLRPTSLGERLPGIMSLVQTHFDPGQLQWIRIFKLVDGLLAPHVDFLEFAEPGVRLQVPLRTSERALHSEKDIVYHLRRGEVWRIHTSDPHSAFAPAGPARLSLCLDLAENPGGPQITGEVPGLPTIGVAERAELDEAELAAMIDSWAEMDRTTVRAAFRQFASIHFHRQAHAADTFTWFSAAARRTGDPDLIAKADAFRVYCIERRAYREAFDW